MDIKKTQISNLLLDPGNKFNKNKMRLLIEIARPKYLDFFKKILSKVFYLIKIHLRWNFLMQRYINRYLPYRKKKFDYKSYDFSNIDSQNSIFLSKKISERTFYN